MNQTRRITLESDGPTVVTFLASSWCGPCKKFGPVKDELLNLNNTIQNQVKFYFQNYEHDNHKNIHDAFGVQSYPTILVFNPRLEKWYQYQGKRDTGSIVDYATKIYDGSSTTDTKLWTTVPGMVKM